MVERRTASSSASSATSICTSRCAAGIAPLRRAWAYAAGEAKVPSAAAAVRTFCLGTFCFHAAFVVLRRQEQLRRLFTSERYPYTMLTFVTMLAAAWNALAGRRMESIVFGLCHLAAFVFDACSHI